MQSKSGDQFDAQENATIGWVVDAYIKRGLFAPGYREDLIQECGLSWIIARESFEIEGKASRRTYQERVLNNRLRNIVEEQRTDKRRINQEALSLDETLGDEADNWTRADQVTRDPWKGPREVFSQADRVLDVAEAFKKLTPAQQKLCRLLGEENLTVTEISTLLNKPRPTLYVEMARIRKLFEKAGLRDYLS